jgi:hypothetical protein
MSFPKQLKPLLEAKNFQLNIDLFCESFREKIEDFRITCCNNSIPETDFIDLTPKADYKPSDKWECDENVGKLHSILVFSKIFSTMHSDSISSNMDKKEVQ